MVLAFISYRGSDQPWVANWLCSELADRLGPDEVFLDCRSIPPGEDYARLLLGKVCSSAILLVVIGPSWYARGPAGRLIDDPEDWVRREIATAFDAGVRVLPVLVGDTATLLHDDLPPEIRRLASLQHLRVRAEDAARDIPRVVDEVVPLGRQGVPRTSRKDVDQLLRTALLPVQRRLGDRSALADVAWALLLPDERPLFLAPCRFAGAAVLLITDRRLCIADVEGEHQARQVLRFPLSQIVRTEVHRCRRAAFIASANLVIHTSSGSRLLVRGLVREQAERVVEVVRG